MAWIRWHLGKAGVRYAHVQWRDPRSRAIRTRALGPLSPEAADEERRHVERAEERREPRGHRTASTDALAAFLRRPDTRPDTHAFYRGLLAPFVAWMGETPIRSWRRVDLERYLSGKTAWSRRRAQAFVRACSTWIRWCREARALDVPDFVGGYKPKAPVHVERPALTGAQLRALLDASRGSRLFLPLALAMFAGLPYSDIRTITWEDIDLSDSRIKRARHKSGEAQRPTIPAALVEALRDNRATHGIVCRDLPKYWAFQKSVRALFKKAKVPRSRGQGVHLIRHSYATLAGKHGDLDTVRVLLGHSKGSSATLRYLHTDDERLRGTSNAVEREILGG